MVAYLILMALFGVLVAGVIWRPSTVLAAAFCVYPFEQWAQANIAFFAVNTQFINYGFGLLMLLAVAVAFMQGSNPITPISPGYLAGFAIYLLAAASCVWSVNMQMSMFSFKFSLPYVLTFVFVTPLVINNTNDLRWGLFSVLLFGAVISLLLLFGTQVHEYGRTIVTNHGENLTNRAGDEEARMAPLIVAEMAGNLILISVLLNFQGVNRIWGVLRWGLVLVALVLIVRSGSRGQLIALVILPLFVGPSRGHSKAFSVFAGIAILAFLAIGVVAVFSGVGGLSDSVFNSRWEVDKMAESYELGRIGQCTKLLTHWLIGGPLRWAFGLGSSASYDPEILGFYPHVVVVEILCELGIVGCIVFGIIVYQTVTAWRKILMVYKDSPTERGAIVALGAVATYTFILSFKQGSFLRSTTMMMSSLVLTRYAAIVLADHRQKTVKKMQMMYASMMQQQQA